MKTPLLKSLLLNKNKIFLKKNEQFETVEHVFRQTEN